MYIFIIIVLEQNSLRGLDHRPVLLNFESWDLLFSKGASYSEDMPRMRLFICSQLCMIWTPLWGNLKGFELQKARITRIRIIEVLVRRFSRDLRILLELTNVRIRQNWQYYFSEYLLSLSFNCSTFSRNKSFRFSNGGKGQLSPLVAKPIPYLWDGLPIRTTSFFEVHFLEYILTCNCMQLATEQK